MQNAPSGPRRWFPFVLLVAIGLLILFKLDPHDCRTLSNTPSHAPGIQLQSVTPRTAAGIKPQIAETYGKLPLRFELNRGQTDSKVKFLSRGGGHALFLTSTEAVLVLSKRHAPKSGLASGSLFTREREEPAVFWNPRVLLPTARDEARRLPAQDRQFQSEVIRLKLVGANPGAQVEGLEELPGKSNYFIGNDASKWRTNVPNYAKVEYRDVYPSVNLVYYGNGEQLEHDFVVAPGTDPSVIRFAVEGSDKVELDAQGDLVLSAKEGEVRLRRPVVYQDVDGIRQEIAGSYTIHANPQSQNVGFQIAAYDATRPLVIDPVLVYSTYLGGSFDEGYYGGIAVDSSGNAYITGYTQSTNFPTANPLQATYGGSSDAFVAKLNAAGSALVYSTYLGGSNYDRALGIAVDSSGNAYITGYTQSTNFPTANPLQATFGGDVDAFVAKLNAAGSALVYSTYLGGSGHDEGRSIAADSSGNAYITGITDSTNLPTANPLQATYAGYGDAFVAKLNAAGSALVYSTYLGGSYGDGGSSIAVDSSGNAYITGYTYSTNFPTANPLQATNAGVVNAFVAKLNAAGSALVYSTYLGGSNYDKALSIAVDSSGTAYITGITDSTNLPTANPLQATYAGSYDGFVAKLNAAGSALVYSTYLGGSGDDCGYGIAVDSSGNAYITGYTYSTNFPTANPLQATNAGVVNAFVAKLNAAGSALIYSTYLGGSGADEGRGIAVDSSGNAYITGLTGSTNFPTAGPLQAANRGGGDAFVAKISAPGAGSITVGTNLSAATFTITGPATYTGSGQSFIATNVKPGTYTVSFGGVAGYATPPSQIRTLSAAGITFSGTYSLVAAPPASTNLGTPGASTNRNGSVAEPVNTATGNYYSSATDLTVPGRGLSFTFTRNYNSQDQYNGPMGFGWTHFYNIYLTVDGTGTVAIKQGDGHQDFYTPATGGNYTAQTRGLFNTLVKNPDNSFTLTFKNQTTFNFSTNGKLASIADRNGNTQALAYDGSGRLASVTDPGGRVFTFNYDGNGRLIKVTDPLARTLQYSYDAAGNLVSSRDSAGATTQYAYDTSHRMTSATDPRGNVYLQNTYDAQGRVVAQTNARSFTTTFAYNTPSTGITTITDPLGKNLEHVYDLGQRLTGVVDALAGQTTYTYDSNNLKASETNALGKASAFTYDGNGNLGSSTDASGNPTTFLYDAQNNLIQVTDPLNRQTKFTYDAKGNLSTATDAAGKITTNTYDASGLLLSTKNARNFTTSFQYDAYGNRTKIIDALGGTVEITYDVVGRLLSTKNQFGKLWTRTYDADDRLLTAADPLGNTSSYAYDANGNRIRVTDANGNSTDYAYDKTNNLVQVTDAMGGVTGYAYDANGNLTTVTDANGHTSKSGYNALGRLTSKTDAIGNVQRYNYDGLGNLISTVDGDGKTNSYLYGASNRRTSAALSDGKAVAYTYDAAGNRLTMTDWRGMTNYTYDNLNRVTSVATPDSKTVGYAYDAVGNRTALTYPDGKVVQDEYDALNRMTKVTDWSGLATTYAYDAAGNLTGQVNPNNTSAAYAYDDAGRLASLVNRSGTQPVSAFSYVLDRVGNRIEVASLTEGVQRYGYDRLYRLTSWTQPSRQIVRYVYDGVGNRTAVHAPSGITNYAYDAADQLLSAGPITFTYDGNGNQLTKTTGGTKITYGWDAVNRLLSVTGGATSTAYQYDGDGNRLGQTVAAGTYAYVNDSVASLPVVLQEAGPEGAISYLHGPVVTMAAGAAFQSYYQVDGLGSVSTVTDGAGALRAGYTYDPWGTAGAGLDLLGLKNKFRFAGEPTDPASGLVYLRARYYDPTTGRFIARDARPDPSGATNLYNYALANPVRFVDKSGFGIFGFIGEFLGLAQRGDQLREARRQAIECAADITCADVDAAQRQFYGAEQEAWKSGGRMAVQGLGIAYGSQALSGGGALQTDIPFQEGSVLYYAQKGYNAYNTANDVTEGVRAYQSLRSGPVPQSPYTNTTGPITGVTGTYASPGSSKRRK